MIPTRPQMWQVAREQAEGADVKEIFVHSGHCPHITIPVRIAEILESVAKGEEPK